MSREEPLEERKLSVVKSWFSRSVSSGALHGPIHYSNSDGNNSDGALASREGMEDRETWAGLTTLRQLSMRRSRPSGEIERESVGSPSMTPRNVTPLTPLTPLKWKSNAREQEEEEKAFERSRLGSGAVSSKPISVLSEGEIAMRNGRNEGHMAELEQEEERINDTSVHDRTKSIDEISLKAHFAAEDNAVVESPLSSDRKPSSGDDVMTMTIEFLRARLLSERSASKAAKQKVQQLGKKVLELEKKLEQAIEDRKKAEAAIGEGPSKQKTAESPTPFAESPTTVAGNSTRVQQDRESPSQTGGLQLTSRSGSAGEEIKEELQHECGSIANLSRTDSHGSSNGSRESMNKQHVPAIAPNDEKGIPERGGTDVWATPQKVVTTSQELTEKQESRGAIENRLRNMWAQISEEMTTLAKARSQEDVVREEINSWMGQVPTVFQDIIPRRSLNNDQNTAYKSPTQGTQGKGVPDQEEGYYPEGMSVKTGLSPAGMQDKGHVEADAKRAAVMLEEYEAQESVQRQWEKNYFESQQKLEQYKGDQTGIGSVADPKDYPQMDYNGGSLPSPDDKADLGLSRSKNSGEFLSVRPNGVPRGVIAPHYESSYPVEKGEDSAERFHKPGTDDGLHDTSHSNEAPVWRQKPSDPTYLDRPQLQREHSAALRRSYEAGPQGWPEREMQVEQDLYYQQAGSRNARHGEYSAYSERGPSNRPSGPPTNWSSEEAYRNSQTDYRDGRPVWDDRGDREGWGQSQDQGGRGGQHPQANHPGVMSGQTDRDHHLRQREREDLYKSMESEGLYRRRHRRSLSDNANWPAVEDYNLPNRLPQHGPGIERQQSYSAYPGSEPSQTSFNNSIHGSYDTLQHRQPGMLGGHGHMQDNNYAAKAIPSSDQHFAPQEDRNGYTKAEPQLSLGYGPAYDVPRDDLQVQLPHTDSSTKSITDVLRALQAAKASIQKAGSDKVPHTNSADQRLSGEHVPSAMNSGSVLEPPTQYIQAPLQISSGQAPENFRYTKNLDHGALAPGRRSFSSMSNSMKYDMGFSGEARVHPDVTGHSSYVDQLNVGKGIQFFFS